MREKIKEYINTHMFRSRRHAYAVRAVISDLYPEDKEFQFKWAFDTKHNGKSVEEELITANDVLKIIDNDGKA